MNRTQASSQAGRQPPLASRADMRVPGRVGLGVRAERGQAAVLAALCLFSMVVFLAMATNAGILVNDRIRMQNTADLTAYSGAFEQARSMNRMANINKRIYEHVQRTRGVLNYGPAFNSNDPPDAANVFFWRQPPCSCLPYSPAAQAYIAASQAWLNFQAAQVQAVNMKVQVTSRLAATNTASINFLGPFAGPRHLNFFASNAAAPTGRPRLVNMNRVNDTMVGYNYVRSCRCCNGCCQYPQIHTEPISTWWYKDSTLVYFPAKVQGVPQKNFVDIRRFGDRYFGAAASKNPADSDMLWGYAVAKPYEGNIGTIKPDNDNPGPLIAENPVYPPSSALSNYFQPTYRARMAGIHEPMGSGVRMADLISQDRTEPKFQSQVKYFAH